MVGVTAVSATKSGTKAVQACNVAGGSGVEDGVHGRPVREVRMQDAAARAEFEAFVRRHWSALMAIAVAVSGSRGEAEDLVQTALTGAWPRWRRIRQDEALAYLRRSILNAHVSRWRRRRGAEVSVAEPPDFPASAAVRLATDVVDDRASLLPALRALPERQRAVLVLRYLCDLPDAEIAATLAISAGTVRSQAARGLAALRATAAPLTVENEVPS
jgi:RNA polymerase sigma-70 factor (sigma-E family)